MSRRHFLTIPILIFFLCMLSFPQTVFAGASYGLLLWFRHVLPTLLPYMVLINILIRTPALHWICHITSPFLCPLLGTSYYGTFAVLTGFLCGYPMGAKTASDLLDAQKISRSEASYLLSFCNNTSPAFILSYVVIQNLKKDFHSVSSYSYTYASYDELCLSSFLPRKRPYPSIFTHDAGFFFNCFTV